MKRVKRWAGFLAVVAVGASASVAACSSSSGDDGTSANGDGGGQDGTALDVFVPPSDGSLVDVITDAGESSKQKACEDYVDALCARLAACGYGDPQCEQKKLACPAFLFGTGSGFTDPAQAATCVAELPDASCLELTNGAQPADCMRSGSRGPGQACAYDSQCSSLTCLGAGSHCGYCAQLVDDGGTGCNQIGYACPHGSRCDYNTTKCTPVVAGGACNVIGPTYTYCPIGLTCARNASDPVNYGTCRLRPEPGEACIITQGDTGNNAFCNGATSFCNVTNEATGAGTCIAYAKIGEACGPNASGVYVSCAGGNCESGDGSPKGTCVAYRAVGQQCGYFANNQHYCDNTTSYCSDPIVAPQQTCAPNPSKGSACGTLPQHYSDGGLAGSTYYATCNPNQTCTNDGCYFANGAPANPICVPLQGDVGDECGYGNCEVCASNLGCVNHKCAAVDLSTCN